MRLGAIEGGGTKFVMAVGDELGYILERRTIPTTTPEETMKEVVDFFSHHHVDAIGLGSFGPVDLDKESPTYGYITTTPKKGWENFDILSSLKVLNIPIGFDTDVNVACLGEATYGAAKGLDSALYLTVGTGIGAGILVEGKLLHGLLHPEAGHILLDRRSDDNYKGKCPYHKSCLEGLASGPAIEERWGVSAKDLSQDHEAWDLEAYYLAKAISNYILIVSPKKVILGGGVMHQKALFPLIRKYVKEFLNDYLKKSEILEDIDNYIVYPKLGDDAGITGAIALALNELENNNKIIL